jgi:hypothetical protein
MTRRALKPRELSTLRRAKTMATWPSTVSGRQRALPPISQRSPREDCVRSCKYCGCTDTRACPDGCCWVSDDVCSACAPELEGVL